MFDRMKRPRRGKGTGDGSGGAEPEAVEYAQAERDTPSFGRRAVPVEGSAEPVTPQPKRPKKRVEEDFTSEPVEDTPATNWRKAAPIAPGEEVKLVKVYKKAGDVNTPSRHKQPALEVPPDESKLTFKREKRFYFAGDAEEEKAKATAKAEAEAAAAAAAAEVAQQTEALRDGGNVTPLPRHHPHADADMAKLEAARAEAARREAARTEAERLEASNRGLADRGRTPGRRESGSRQARSPAHRSGQDRGRQP